MKFIDLLLKQHDIGQWWGGFRSTVSSASLYITLFNTALLVPMAYVTWVQPWSVENGMNLSFWLFVLIILIAGILLLLFEYKFFTPSGFSFWTGQFWKHQNPIRKEFKGLEKRLKKIEEMLQDEKRK